VDMSRIRPRKIGNEMERVVTRFEDATRLENATSQQGFQFANNNNLCGGGRGAAATAASM